MGTSRWERCKQNSPAPQLGRIEAVQETLQVGAHPIDQLFHKPGERARNAGRAAPPQGGYSGYLARQGAGISHPKGTEPFPSCRTVWEGAGQRRAVCKAPQSPCWEEKPCASPDPPQPQPGAASTRSGGFPSRNRGAFPRLRAASEGSDSQRRKYRPSLKHSAIPGIYGAWVTKR